MNTKLLKQKVLDLAIHGKLVPQNPNDEPASVLLERIRAEKEERIKKGELKRDKKDSYIIKIEKDKYFEELEDSTLIDINKDIPFEVPSNWTWVRLKDICTKLVDGDHNPPKGEKAITPYLMISSRNINNNDICDLENVRYLSKNIFENENERTKLQNGDILFTSVGTIGRSCIYNGNLNICFQRSVTILNTLVNNTFIKYCFDSTFYQQYAIKNATGTAQLGFYLTPMAKSLIPLPPLEEQQRIVEQIDKIFTQIDLLEENQTDLNELITKSKAKILDLAIHGKLVEQDANEEKASILLEKIRAEKEERIKKGNLKRDKKESYIYKDDNGNYIEKFYDGTILNFDYNMDFAIPSSWMWCHLSDICKLKGGKRIPVGMSATSEKTTHIYIRVTDMQNESISKDNLLYITDDIYQLIKQYTISKDDLYLTVAGTIGKVGQVPIEFDKMNLTENALKLTDISINKTFLMKVLNSKFVQDYFSSTYHQVGTPKLSLINASKTLIPLPPLKEQERIVIKINELYKELDSIFESLQ